MQSVLSFDFGGGSFDKIFQIYSANPYGVEYFKREHESMGGVLSEDSVGYRRLFEIDFQPLGADKQASYFLSLFMAGKNRQITIDATTYPVTIPESYLKFDFYDQVYFANAFSLKFMERGTFRRITDTGSTRILKPIYTPAGQGISGETLTIMCNLEDEYSIEARKHNLKFINENVDDVALGYRHILNIDFGYIKDSAYRDWLIDFALWGHKQIDLTGIDSLNGKVYDVIFGDKQLLFPFSRGVKDALTCKTVFKEKTLHTDFEAYTAPSPFILDDNTLGVLDNNNYLG